MLHRDLPALAASPPPSPPPPPWRIAPASPPSPGGPLRPRHDDPLARMTITGSGREPIGDKFATLASLSDVL